MILHTRLQHLRHAATAKIQCMDLWYNTNNFYENCGVKNAIGNNQTFNNFPIEQTIELFEKLLEKQKEQFESLKKEK